VLVTYGYDLDGVTDAQLELNVADEHKEKCREMYRRFSRSETVFAAIAWTIFYFPYVLISSYFILGQMMRKLEAKTQNNN
jgi:hypothetical protein